MNSVDGMLNKASGSMCPYIVIFTVMIVALIYKLKWSDLEDNNLRILKKIRTREDYKQCSTSLMISMQLGTHVRSHTAQLVLSLDRRFRCRYL